MSAGEPGRQLSVVVPASNEEATIDAVLQEALALDPLEVVVVVNGSQDRTAALASARKARVVNTPERLGHDVGRGVGAALARGSILLFVDADIRLPASALQPFVAAIASGHDVALNDIDSLVSRYPWDPVSIQKAWLNRCLGRADLGTASLTAVPHALSRRVFSHITVDDLMVPPKAYAKLVSAQLDIVKAASVDVVTTNKIHGWNARTDGRDRVVDLILGDHLEALEWLRTKKGGPSEDPTGRAP
jgi:glycosyltransferase involved in cell wall biosynthesis